MFQGPSPIDFHRSKAAAGLKKMFYQSRGRRHRGDKEAVVAEIRGGESQFFT
jgi:hypothetical protein